MEKAIARLEFSEDEDNGEIVDVGADLTNWERTHAIRYPMPKDTLWGSELILGTILDSKGLNSCDQFNFVPSVKPLPTTTTTKRPSSPPPPPPSSPTSTSSKTTPTFLTAVLSKATGEKKLKDYLLNENIYEMDEKDSRLLYKSNLTEGTMFDLIEKPVRTTVDNFQHEWSVSVNDYSTMRMRKVKYNLNINEDCSDLTTGTYLETMSVSQNNNEKKDIWSAPSLPGSRTQSDISFDTENNERGDVQKSE